MMLQQQLLWIFSLLFLCPHGADSVSMQVCEGGSAYIVCESGSITITAANYGRTDSVTCASGTPAFELLNTNCFAKSSLYIVSIQCNGKSECTVLVSNSVFSDPCYGTYKYLDVSYNCIPSQRSVTCENSQSVISCAAGVISIIHANYGREDGVTCASGKPANQISNTQCFDSVTLYMATQCDGQQSCSVLAANSVFTDPCVGTYKYLDVSYNCIPTTNSVTCENSQSVISCATGVIMVFSANYGRQNHVTCGSGRPANQLSNSQCTGASSFSIMSTRCDGRQSCSVLAANSIFTDPCYGTYKYLNVTYYCVTAQMSVTCENSQSVISCATGVIFIYYANYGRRDLVTCPNIMATTPDCYSPQTSSLSSSCNGKTSCTLNASNSVFSDPCPGVSKYLEVAYACVV